MKISKPRKKSGRSAVILDKALAEEAVNELRTIQDFLRWAATQFAQANLTYGQGAETAFEEALLLVLSSLHLPIEGHEHILCTRLIKQERELVVSNIKKRIELRMPAAYITNRAWFCDTEFYVDERVLVPRSPIGELIQNNFSGLLPYEPERILDLCTGSGCIAIACAYAFTNAEVDAVDLSEDALQVAEFNIERHGLQAQVTPICSDLFSELPGQRYDLIVSNPPYVDQASLAQLPKEFTYEPMQGFAGGVDGLDLIRIILREAPNHLEEEGVLICEVGQTADALQAAFPALPFHWIGKKRGEMSLFAINREALQNYLSQKWISPEFPSLRPAGESKETRKY